MFRVINVRAEMEKVARGQKTTIGIEDLAECLLLQMGPAPKKRKTRKPEDIAFLERLYRLKDERT